MFKNEYCAAFFYAFAPHPFVAKACLSSHLLQFFAWPFICVHNSGPIATEVIQADNL